MVYTSRIFGDCIEKCRGTVTRLNGIKICSVYTDDPKLDLCINPLGNFEGELVGICKLAYKSEKELSEAFEIGKKTLGLLQRI